MVQTVSRYIENRLNTDYPRQEQHSCPPQLLATGRSCESVKRVHCGQHHQWIGQGDLLVTGSGNGSFDAGILAYLGDGHLRRRPTAQALMWALVIVELEVAVQPCLQVWDIGTIVKVDVLVLNRAPRALEEGVVQGSDSLFC